MKDDTTNLVRAISAIAVLAGAWLVVSPFILTNASTQAYWNAILIGLAVIVFGVVRLLLPSQLWASWAVALAGVWLVLAPFVLGFTSEVSYWNQAISGLIIASLGFMSVATERTHTGHHGGHPVH